MPYNVWCKEATHSYKLEVADGLGQSDILPKVDYKRHRLSRLTPIGLQGYYRL